MTLQCFHLRTVFWTYELTRNVFARSAYSHPGALESKCSSVRAAYGKKVIFAKGTSVYQAVISALVKIQNRVREKRDFCEGYKRLGQGHIRLDNFSEVKSRFWKKTFTNWDLRIGIHLDRIHFWTPFLEQKNSFPHFCEQKSFVLQKSTPIYSCGKWSKGSKPGASRHLPCRVLSSWWSARYYLFTLDRRTTWHCLRLVS